MKTSLSTVRIFILTLSLTMAGVSFAQEPAVLLDSAAQAYNKGHYASAVSFCERTLAAGYESAAVYYNLGNAWFKQNEMAAAIYNYERALLLAPGDEDILHNLKIANSRIIDKIEVVPDLFFERWWKSFYNLFPGDTWALLSLVFLSMFLTALSVFFLSGRTSVRRAGFWSAVVFLVFIGFSTAFAWKNHFRSRHKDHGIVFSPSITAKSSPDASSVDLFVLHEGTKVQIGDRVDQWIRIRIANGTVGWIPAESVKEF